MERCVTGPSTSIPTSWPTCARVRRCCGNSTRIVTAISTASSLHVGFLQVEGFPFLAGARPNFSKDAFCLAGFAAGFAFVLRDVGDQGRVRSERLHREIAQG